MNLKKTISQIVETKAAPKGFHFTKDGKLKRGDADIDGSGGKMLRADPLDKQRSKVPPVTEAVMVKKKDYSWGKMMTVHHGNETSYPLHPEHQAKIKALKPGEKTSFTDETKKRVTAEREGDKVHLSGQGMSKKTTVAHSHFTESNNFFKLRESLVEKTLTPAEKKKREEIAKAMERENPGMPMAQKMAIATAQAKKVAESIELNEEENEHWTEKQSDGTHKVYYKTSGGETKHIGTITPPRRGTENRYEAKHVSGSKMTPSSDINSLAKSLAKHHRLNFYESVDMQEEYNNEPPSAEEQQKHKEAIANHLNANRRPGLKPIKPEQITHHSVSSTVTGVQAHTYKVQHHNNPAIKMPSHTLHTITPGGNVKSGETRLRGNVQSGHVLLKGKVKEEVELDEEQMYYSLVHKSTKKVLSTHKSLESAKDEHQGMDHGIRAHFYIATSKKEPKTFNMKEEVKLDEISQNLALNTYAQRAARAAKTGDKKDYEKADKTITRIGKKWTSDEQRRAWNRADKLIDKQRNEEVEELEELKRSTLASYTQKAADQMAHAAIEKSTGAAKQAMGSMGDVPELKKQGEKQETKAFKTILKRSKGIADASRRLAKEEIEVEEAVEDRIYDKGHSPERLQKTIDKAREHEKSYFKKRADSFFKPTDYESRSKEDSRLQRVRKVMHAASAAKQYATGTAPKPFTGRIGRKQ